jgi:predicted membrane chloride channel (bestrophin family)
MSTRTTTLEDFTADDGTRYQLLYTPASAAPWTLIIDGRQEASYDEYSEARRAWREAMSEVTD